MDKAKLAAIFIILIMVFSGVAYFIAAALSMF